MGEPRPKRPKINREREDDAKEFISVVFHVAMNRGEPGYLKYGLDLDLRDAFLSFCTMGADDYLPGNIVEIELHNFMTFDDLVCKPGPRLNLVIGPNGSGKSSLVCAIALGLGGEPQLLGRAGSVGAFVKRGAESGYTKITLRGDTPDEKIIIMRKIDARNKSEWLYNGRGASKKEVLDIIQKFNIQVNNLTQFLPQDRVCEFAKLSPVRLLEETEKAVGDPQLPVLHRALIDTSAELQRSEQASAVEKNRETLSQLKALNAEQERDVERVRQRDELLSKAESMKKKLPWLKYDMKRAEYLEAKDQEIEAKKKMEEAAKILNDIREPIDKQKKEKKDHDIKCNKLRELLDNIDTSRKQMLDKENQLGAKVKGKYKDMEELEKQEQSRQARIAKAEKDLADAELELQNLPRYEPPREKIVNISNAQHAAYLEKQIGYYMWKMSSIGVYSRLDQVFDAPHAVKEVMIGQFNLECSYIGSKKADENADKANSCGIMDLWTPGNHYRWNKSRYGSHVSTSVESVGDSRLLLSNTDGDELNNLRVKKKELEESVTGLEASFRSLQIEIKELEDEAAQLQKERENLINEAQHEKRKLREMQTRVTQKRSRLQSMGKEEDMAVAMSKLVEDVENLNVQRFKCVLDLKNLLTQATAHRRSYAEKLMTSTELEIKIKEMEATIKQQEKLALQATINFENCKSEVENHRQQLAAAKRAAESVAVITPALEREFVQMPSTIEELNAAIQDIASQANSILFLNHNILEEYERRQRKDRWLPTLRNLVAQINETFSRNFQEMAVAGEVSLDEHGNQFDSYGILIKVKFRQAGQLQVLSAHHQSGGERSVSTILYLVSLQDLTHCPFRVVDEINQGMDPINERKMFQQLVRAASQPNTPQCFLLTPKLLSDLEYGEACTILTVMTGPWIEQPSADSKQQQQNQPESTLSRPPLVSKPLNSTKSFDGSKENQPNKIIQQPLAEKNAYKLHAPLPPARDLVNLDDCTEKENSNPVFARIFHISKMNRQGLHLHNYTAGSNEISTTTKKLLNPSTIIYYSNQVCATVAITLHEFYLLAGRVNESRTRMAIVSSVTVTSISDLKENDIGYLELEKSAVIRWLLQFSGFKERLLADDLFLTKVGIECGVGIFTKGLDPFIGFKERLLADGLFLTKVGIECGVGIFTKSAAELEKRRENFSKELDFVCADVIMAIIADFMLVWLPAPTVSLRPPVAISANIVTKFFSKCPDNAFQRNGAKLFAVGTSASLVGTGVTNLLINARKAVDKTFAGEAEDIPILPTSIAYGVYMSVSANLSDLNSCISPSNFENSVAKQVLDLIGMVHKESYTNKSAAELEKRRENFSKELDFVCADVIMAIIADFMLVWLPAPTVSLRPPVAISANIVTKFFSKCPDNAFQRNGAKLFAVGTSASLVGTGVTNLLINARKAVDKTFAGEAEDIPILPTSIAYGVYMSVSANLRYQVGRLCTLDWNTKVSGMIKGLLHELVFAVVVRYINKIASHYINIFDTFPTQVVFHEGFTGFYSLLEQCELIFLAHNAQKMGRSVHAYA
ncbi:structural maintenance of chromosomes protein 5 [Artemisia annua]|uniref:Structural maintenance of chromosomes protein 5 n=2 Tax=Magnoliopsida TaxID=3398 RepID=A0A2U1LS84_ARTAN|nr:structural maintenance of chromosomes protein 5 [Artemisia annua]